MDKELILEIPSNHTEAAIVSFSFFINETTLNWNELYFGVETGFFNITACGGKGRNGSIYTAGCS